MLSDILEYPKFKEVSFEQFLICWATISCIYSSLMNLHSSILEDAYIDLNNSILHLLVELLPNDPLSHNTSLSLIISTENECLEVWHSS